MTDFNIGDAVYYIGSPIPTIRADAVGIVHKVFDFVCHINFSGEPVTLAKQSLRKLTKSPVFKVGDLVKQRTRLATDVTVIIPHSTIKNIRIDAGEFEYFTTTSGVPGARGPIAEGDLVHKSTPDNTFGIGDSAVYTGAPYLDLPRYAAVSVVKARHLPDNRVVVVKFNDKLFSIYQNQLKPVPDATKPAPMQRNNDVYDLIPYQEISESFMRVAEYGAKKYDPWDWSKGEGMSRVKILGSLLRHTFQYIRGVDRDESGELHSDHILWNAVALVHNVHHGLRDGRRVEGVRGYRK